jgi:proteasome lid subunit RPN8/RPN11
MRPFSHLEVPQRIVDEMRSHVVSESPLECCGLLVGRIENGVGIVLKGLPIRNDLASPTEYLTNPRDLLDAMKTMRAEAWEPLAIYHSHPASDAVPSRTDLERNTWGETVVHLILGRDGLRAWWLREVGFEEVEIEQ